MKKILTATILALAALTCSATTDDTTTFDSMPGSTVTVYNKTEGIERVEVVSPYMTKKEAAAYYAEVINKFENDKKYVRLNGGKSQVLFMEGNNINRNVLIARLKSVYGYRIVVAYDNFKDKED